MMLPGESLSKTWGTRLESLELLAPRNMGRGEPSGSPSPPVSASRVVGQVLNVA
jgi:hypothetical protein